MLSGHIALAVASSLVILWIMFDAFELMLLPRRATWPLRFPRVFFRAAWGCWRALALRLRAGKRREVFLSIYGPLSLVSLLGVWVAMLIVSFGFLHWALAQGRPASPSFESALYLSGVTFFTLGYGDVLPRSALEKAAAVAEAGMGLGLIAIIIGYLPVLYQLFSRREAQIIRLDVRAGSPPTATTLLVRYAEGLRLDALDALLAEWELWAAELLESQLSYPMLAFYRSQQPDESWLAALTTTMDLCALILVGFRDVNTFQARVTFGTARLALMEMGRLFTPEEILPGANPVSPPRLSPPEFRRLHQTLLDAGLDFSFAAATTSSVATDIGPLGETGGVERELAKFRATYEPYAQALAGHLLLQLPAWVAPAGQLDNWQRSESAHSIKRLVEGVEAQPK